MPITFKSLKLEASNFSVVHNMFIAVLYLISILFNASLLQACHLIDCESIYYSWIQIRSFFGEVSSVNALSRKSRVKESLSS